MTDPWIFFSAARLGDVSAAASKRVRVRGVLIAGLLGVLRVGQASLAVS